MNDTIIPAGNALAVPDSSERQWAAASHWGGMVLALLTSWSAGFAGVAGGLVVWLVKRHESAFVADHAKEAMNFNISMFLYVVATIVLAVFTLGLGLIVAIPLWIVLGLVWLICGIIATMKALNGEIYRYPLTIRLIR